METDDAMDVAFPPKGPGMCDTQPEAFAPLDASPQSSRFLDEMLLHVTGHVDSAKLLEACRLRDLWSNDDVALFYILMASEGQRRVAESESEVLRIARSIDPGRLEPMISALSARTAKKRKLERL